VPGLAYSSLRVREKYIVTNNGEKFEVEVEKILSANDFLLKDIHTLEKYLMSDLTQFGKGNDWLITEY
jgi:hypothetical protein